VITTWRIVKAKYAEDAFSGIASRKHGGRWNPPGVAVVYTSDSPALATLELLVHIESDVLNDFALISCSFHEALIDQVDSARIPDNFRAVPPPAALQQIGYEWVTNGSSPVLKVPSAVVPEQFNYLLNPEHPDFRSIDVGQPRPFTLDYRLLT
jgi:RES domain-containing protein